MAISLGGRTGAGGEERKDDNSTGLELRGPWLPHAFIYHVLGAGGLNSLLGKNSGGGGKKLFVEVSRSVVSVDCVLT